MIKIIDHVLRDYTFNELGISATFKHKDDFFLRIEDVETEFHKYNAVKLNSGTLYTFNAEDIVIPFNCELIIL